MKESRINGYNPKDEEIKTDEYTIPNEGYCSPEFPEGCILVEET